MYENIHERRVSTTSDMQVFFQRSSEREPHRGAEKRAGVRRDPGPRLRGVAHHHCTRQECCQHHTGEHVLKEDHYHIIIILLHQYSLVWLLPTSSDLC